MYICVCFARGILYSAVLNLSTGCFAVYAKRIRRTLGKLLWLAQSRHDLKVWLSLIGTQQASPKHGTEMAGAVTK